jgi:capsular polysaccharide biosynthesis protein
MSLSPEVILLYPAPEPLDIRPREDNQVPLLESVQLYKVNDALITPYGYVIKKFDVLYEAVTPRHRNALNPINLFAFRFLKKKIHIEAPCLSIANGWIDSYYHFTLESLPKLYLMRDYIAQSTLVFHSLAAGFHAEWFEIIGIKNIRYINNKEVVETPLAITTSFASQDLNFHHTIIPEFRQWILSRIIKSDSFNFKKIFISRKKPRHRRLLNEDAVISLLSGYGFVTIYMEDYSVADQVRIFSQADHIICIHGAALTNLCFSNSGTKVLDLIHEDFTQWCFLKLSMILHLEYDQLKCSGAKLNLPPGYDDIKVNIDQLKQKVNQQDH